MSHSTPEPTALSPELKNVVRNTIGAEIRNLTELQSSIIPERVAECIHALSSAKRIIVQGIGTSGALASYAETRLARRGFQTTSTDITGLRLADFLIQLRPGDVLLVTSRVTGHRDIDVAMSHAANLGVRCFSLPDLMEGELSRAGALVLIDMISSALAVLNPSMVEETNKTLNALRAELAGRPMDIFGAIRDLDSASTEPR
ncbi:MurR/RpiR family transcriptional regulator [Thalassospira alkalitolerans]|uniref:MurR/RpiR family transcriptional regulator n=1 Tax=Thalassospira alkalitolerans TaxID=1293890 RepID=UPI003AA9C45D